MPGPARSSQPSVFLHAIEYMSTIHLGHRYTQTDSSGSYENDYEAPMVPFLSPYVSWSTWVVLLVCSLLFRVPVHISYCTVSSVLLILFIYAYIYACKLDPDILGWLYLYRMQCRSWLVHAVWSCIELVRPKTRAYGYFMHVRGRRHHSPTLNSRFCTFEGLAWPTFETTSHISNSHGNDTKSSARSSSTS